MDHVPVLPTEVLDLLDPQSGDVVVDATIGLGGHARLLLERIGPRGRLIGLDVDDDNLKRAGTYLEPATNVTLVRANFGDIATVLKDTGTGPAHRLLADLGISSRQLDDAERGFSFTHDGPLDMRLDQRLPTTASDLVNRLTETELADLIYHNSQERGSRRIARAIHHARRDSRITSTARLADIVCRALRLNPDHPMARIHPATRTFMALRIAVNDELQRLTDLLAALPDVLVPGGRAAVISFHSLEDGLVKRSFRTMGQQGLGRLVTRKPVIATTAERQDNPRARSAKLRVIERTDGPASGKEARG